MSTELAKINDFKNELHKAHYKTMVNFLGNEENAKKFMSAVMFSVQKTPKLLECRKDTLFNAFMQCAELGMYPSASSGECYILPYEKKKKQGSQWVIDHVYAQFQLGYQGLITLLYGAGVTSIRSEIIRKNDTVEYINGKIKHEIDVFKSQNDRGEAIGCYAIFKVNGEDIVKVMNKDDILKFKAFSKSSDTKYSPWLEINDPELWMWKKTVIKQGAKLLPKNEKLNRLLEMDNQDSKIGDGNIEDISNEEVTKEILSGFEASTGEQKAISQ